MKEINITASFLVFDSLKELPNEVQNLMNQAIEIRKKAYAPYSQFRVGCALLLDNGEIILGSNQEQTSTLSRKPRIILMKSSLFAPHPLVDYLL